MSPLANVARPIAVVAAGNDVQQSTGVLAISVLIDGKYPTEAIQINRSRFAESPGDLTEMRPVVSATKQTPSVPLDDSELLVACSDDLKVLFRSSAESEVQIPQRIKREPVETVVRNVSLGIDPHDHFAAIGPIITIIIVQQQEDIPCRHIDRASWGGLAIGGLCRQPDRPHDNAGDVFQTVRKDFSLIRFDITICVTQNKDAVGEMSFTPLGFKMSVVLHHPDTPQFVDIESRRSSDWREVGEQLNLQSGIERTRGNFTRPAARCPHTKQDEGRYYPAHDWLLRRRYSRLKARQRGLGQEVGDLATEKVESLVERTLRTGAAPAFAEGTHERVFQAIERGDNFTQCNEARRASECVTATGTGRASHDSDLRKCGQHLAGWGFDAF